MKSFRLLLAALALTGIVSSCNNEPYFESQDEKFIKGFIKEFGLIDKNQDFNLGEQSSVTVDAGQLAKDIYVAVNVSGQYYRVAHLTNVSGTVTIPVDVPEGTTTARVWIDGKAQNVTLNGKTRQSRATVTETDAINRLYDEHGNLVYRTFTYNEIMAPTNGAGTSGPGMLPEEVENTGKHGLIDNFRLVSNGKFVLYPIYWNSAAQHIIGFYYYDDVDGVQTMEYIAAYRTKYGNDILISEDYKPGRDEIARTAFFQTNWVDGVQETTCVVDDEFIASHTWYCMDCYDETAGQSLQGAHHIAQINSDGSHIHDDGHKCWANTYYYECDDETEGHAPTGFTHVSSAGTWEICGYDAEAGTIGPQEVPMSVANTYKCAGIEVNIPKGMEFGMYIRVFENGNGSIFDGISDYSSSALDANSKFKHILFSEAELNQTDPRAQQQLLLNGGSSGGKEYNPELPLSDENNPLNECSYFSYFDMNVDGVDMTYIGIEDWGVNVNDLNDIILVIGEGSKPTAINKTEEYIEEQTQEPEPDPEDPAELPELSFLIAAEDLGCTDDFDFNDVVFSITSLTVNGESDDAEPTKQVTVKALAAGGTLPVFLHYNDNGTDYLIGPEGAVTTESIGAEGDATPYEWHQWFTMPSGNKARISDMVNTSSKKAQSTASIVISDYIDALRDPSWTIEEYGKIDEIARTVNGFYLTVNSYTPVNNMNPIYDDRKNSVGQVNIAPPNPGDAPQMFCIPDVGHIHGKGWHWPAERMHILDAYQGFSDWIKNTEGSQTWHTNVKNTKFVIRL